MNLLVSQMAQMLGMQKETNILLRNQQNAMRVGSLKNNEVSNQRIDSLQLKVADLEKKMNKMDSLLKKTQDTKVLSSPIKEAEVISNKSNLIKKVVKKPLETPNQDVKNPELDNARAIITYPINQTDINDLQRTLILEEVLKPYNSDGIYYIKLEAYTDASGSATYNKKIAKIRISKVMQFLTTYGVKSADIVTENFGDSKASKIINKEDRKIILKLIKK